MGFFGSSQDESVTEEVETATSEKNVEEDWGLIMSICDKAGKSNEEAKLYLKAIVKRLYNQDPHIGLKAVILLDACVKNSGRKFHIELASRDFENDFIKLMTKANPTVAKKLRESLKKWSENEFKSDGQLSLIPSLYTKLKNEGHDFSISEPSAKKLVPQIKDPNFVESQEEEEQIMKAIELSLKETGSPRSAALSNIQTSTSLYPSVSSMATGTVTSSAPAKEPRKVRALYDFEAAEDNELTFLTGEIIVVTDDSDPNWWKGSNHRGEGLFPANFVTTDLSVEPEKFLYEKAKKMVQFKESAEIKVMKEEPVEVEINEVKIDRLLHLLHEADPTNPEKDTEEMLKLEREVNNMGPLIDAELERVDRKHAQLTQLSADLVEALGLYHSLMREPQFPIANKLPYGYPVTSQPMPFSGNIPNNVAPNMPPPGMHHIMPGPSNHPVQANYANHATHPRHTGIPSQHSSGMPVHQPHSGIPGQPIHPGMQHGHQSHPGMPSQQQQQSHPGMPGPQTHPGMSSAPGHPIDSLRSSQPGISGVQPPPPPHLSQLHPGNLQAAHQYPMMPMPMDAVNRVQMGGQMPQPGMPSMHDIERRLHEHQAQQQQPGMQHYTSGPGVPNYVLPPGMMQHSFPPSGPVQQTQIPNGPQLQGNPQTPFGSSTHITQ